MIKSHGGTDAFGFASAIGVGYDMAESDLIARLAADLEALHGKLGESQLAGSEDRHDRHAGRPARDEVQVGNH